VGGADEKFRREWRTPGFLYIALSPSTKLLKIGITEHPTKGRGARLSTEGYGGLSDWTMLYRRKFKDAGRIEYNVKTSLFAYKTSLPFTRKGLDTRKRKATELFNCDYSLAKQAIEARALESLEECWERPGLEGILQKLKR
jgi:hypothetical protein